VKYFKNISHINLDQTRLIVIGSKPIDLLAVVVAVSKLSVSLPYIDKTFIELRCLKSNPKHTHA